MLPLSHGSPSFCIHFYTSNKKPVLPHCFETIRDRGATQIQTFASPSADTNISFFCHVKNTARHTHTLRSCELALCLASLRAIRCNRTHRAYTVPDSLSAVIAGTLPDHRISNIPLYTNIIQCFLLFVKGVYVKKM